jgi:hypothetical protein
MIFAPRSCPSNPGLATTILIFLTVSVGTIESMQRFGGELTVVQQEVSTVSSAVFRYENG